ncbi:hypothetical protein ABUE31_06820 [Mesorhizobium sp. ZMM04-5]|uniref:Glycosyltransferase RgtA/B/C/D-like domain-containing protein n=1 Tax=Mesorhizobium marinum TaxID=3228790 RepID=A0ABV3QXK0_9HYPH
MLVVALLSRGRSYEEILLRGPAVGFAAAVYLALVSSYLHLALFWAAWPMLALALFLIVWRIPLRLPWPARLDVVGCWLVIVIALVLVTRLLPTQWHVLPPGWDSTFHLLLAKKILTAQGMIYDWLPFEAAGLNYPVGSHLLIAEFSLATGLPPHTVFKFLVPLFGAITTAQIFVFTLRVSGHRELALYAAASYGLLAVLGSIDYYRWGGLPNLIGMSFFLECLIVSTERRPGMRDVALFGLLFTAIFFTHHHVMVTAGLTFAAMFAVCLLRREEHARARLILGGLLTSLAIGCFYIVPYALKATGLGDTSIFRFEETFISFDSFRHGLGHIFSTLAALGLATWLVLWGLRRQDVRFDLALWVPLVTIASLFVIFAYAVRAITLSLYGTAYAVFTPSRFQTDLVYFLAVFAGYIVFAARRSVPIPVSAGVSVASLALLYLAFENRERWNVLYEPNMPYERYMALDWISKNTPPNTIVLSNDPAAAYVSWRRTLNTPIPISEPRPKRGLTSKDIVRLRTSKDASAEARTWQLVAVAPLSTAGPGDEVLWANFEREAVILKKRAQ